MSYQRDFTSHQQKKVSSVMLLAIMNENTHGGAQDRQLELSLRLQQIEGCPAVRLTDSGIWDRKRDSQSSQQEGFRSKD